jgi:hypothetical protein
MFFRPVAQLAEHVTLNHGVEGSIPSRPTYSVLDGNAVII